jgi:mannonate dehydratase
MLGCCGALAAGLFTGLTAHAAGPLRNPCRGPWSASGAGQALVEQAFEGVDAARLVDTHAHLLGTGDAGSGCTIHPSMHQWWRPVEVLRRRAILDASCVAPDAPSIDRAYVERLQVLAADFPAGARWWLFAFEQAYDDAGRLLTTDFRSVFSEVATTHLGVTAPGALFPGFTSRPLGVL